MPFANHPGSSEKIDGKDRNDSRETNQKTTRHWQEMIGILTHW